MKCPNCHNEVLSDPVCPYCGATVYVPAPKPRIQPQAPATNERRSRSIRTYDTAQMENRIQKIDTKLSILLILQCGSFILIILALLYLAF